MEVLEPSASLAGCVWTESRGLSIEEQRTNVNVLMYGTSGCCYVVAKMYRVFFVFFFSPMSLLDTCIILAHIKSLVKMHIFGGLE